MDMEKANLFGDSPGCDISASLSGKKFYCTFIAVNIILICCGILFSVFAGELTSLVCKKGWDARIYYHDQFLFFGRMALAAVGVLNLWLFLLKKKISLVQSLIICAIASGFILQIDSYCRRFFWNDTLALAVYLKYYSWKELFLPGFHNPYSQSAPPAFLFISKLIGEILGFNKWTLTFPALLFSLAALLEYRKFTAKLLPPWACAAAMWLFVLNPGVWVYAGEFKQYCCDFFFTIAVVSAAVDYTKDEEKAWKRLLVLGIFAPFFLHAMFFVLPSVGFALLVHYLCNNKHKSFWMIAVCWFAVVLGIAAYTKMMMPSDMYVHEHHIKGFAPLPDSWENIKWYYHSLTSLFIAPWGLAWRYSILIIFPFIGMCIGIRKIWNKHHLPVIAGGVILLLLYIASALHQYSVASGMPFAKGRLILFTIPLAILIFCGSLERKKALYWVIPVILSAFLNCCTAVIPFGAPKSAVKELLSRYQKGDLVLVAKGISHLSILLYAPEFKDIQLFDLKKFPEKLKSADFIHVFIADLPHGELPLPENYTVQKVSAFAFSEIITLKRKENRSQSSAGGTAPGQ